MFGNLFNEDISQLGAEASAVSTISGPPPHRAESGLAGIDNQGATCYLNSLLQTLLLTPEFRERLFSLTEKDLGSLSDQSQSKVRVIPLQLQRLFSQLLLSDQQSVSTTHLTNSFGWTNQEEFQQHDVQELNRILFSAIEDSLVGTPAQNMINELYHGTSVNQIVCSRCKKVSEREEDFLDLTVAVAGLPGLESALKQYYCDRELMDGHNQYRCENCQTYTDATKGAKLRTLPPILTFSLLRFSYDFTKMTRYKENGRFTFPLHLDMAPFSDQVDSGGTENLYELFSVVVHRGSAFGGHYFAYIRDIDCLGHWAQHETGTEQAVDPRTTGLDVIECQSPVDLVENILAQDPHHSMSVSRLCAEITKVTGVSWNNRFKKTHGPINKFLKSSSLFEYNPDSAWVSLKNPGQRSAAETGPGTADPPVNPASNGDMGRTGNHGMRNPESDSKMRLESLESEPAHHWFCFNDSKVTPIQTKDIERQYSGKESAYMLFYRKKNLQRPPEAQGVPSYKIPGNLLKEMEELNAALEKERQDYERAVNTVTVRVFKAEDFTYNNILKLKAYIPEDSASSLIDIDKRCSLQDLRIRIKEVMTPADNSFCVHRMKTLCGGYHLYDQLQDDTTQLKDVKFTSETLLLLWNGSMIDNTFIQCGEAYEPYTFIIKDPEENTLASVVLAKNRSLSDLYQLVAQMLACQEFSLFYYKVVDNDQRNQEALCRTQNTTLTAAGLTDGANLLFLLPHQNSSPSYDPAAHVNGETNSDPEWSILLLNRLLGVDDKAYTCKTVHIRTKSSTTIGHFKLQAMQLLNVDKNDLQAIRLRENHKILGLQAPLREGLTLVDAGLSSGASLVLESGRPPGDCEMTVYVHKLDCGKLMAKQEFLVDRTLSVSDMLQAACQTMNCEGVTWYLSKTDMYGDPADPLDDFSASLVDALVNEGDTLILQQGSLIKKDQVSVKIWLAPSFESVPVVDWTGKETGGGDVQRKLQEAEEKMMVELAAKLSLRDQTLNSSLNALNECLCVDLQPLFDSQLVIPKSVSVEELKQDLMSSQQCQDMMIPTLNFMRLRLVEGTRLRGVLRNKSQVFRHASSRETLNLGIQVLKLEENLGIHEVLLMVARKIGGTRLYLPAQEVVWNTSSGVGAADLKKVIAARLGLPLHDVLVAKYSPESFEWLVLRDQPQKHLKSKGRKKVSTHKTNIRQAPYFIQDGDLLGVKLLSADKGILDPDDFSTQEDIIGRQLVLNAAEEKRKMREEKKKTHQFEDIPKSRRPEVPLTIKVDSFA